MNEVERFKEIQEKVNKISQEKIRIEERFRSERKKLEALVKEIEGKGLDPKNLSSTRDKLEEDLNTEMGDLEAVIKSISDKLEPMEGVL